MSIIGRLSRAWVGIAFVVAACNHGNYIGATAPMNDGGSDTSLHPPGPVAAVFTDYETSCAVIDPGGRLYCWGNEYPPVSGRAQIAYLTATPAGIDNVQQVTRDCVLSRDGTVSCWSGYDQVQLVAVAGLNQVKQIVTGDCDCALGNDGTVRCWASDYGYCEGATGSPTPTATVPGLSNVVQLAGGPNFVCARRADGTVWCWGGNRYGQLGDGGGTPSATPKQVSLPAPAKAIAANPYLACAVLDNGQVSCWGNWAPCLALECGPTPMRPTTLTQPGQTDNNGEPVPVTNVVDVAIENPNLCLLQTDPGPPELQYLDCVENPGMSSQYPPFLNPLMGTSYSRLSVSFNHGCALKDDGEVYCWGDNTYGAVGSGQIGEIWPQPTGVHW